MNPIRIIVDRQMNGADVKFFWHLDFEGGHSIEFVTRDVEETRAQRDFWLTSGYEEVSYPLFPNLVILECKVEIP